MILTAPQLKQCYPYAKQERIDLFLTPINETLVKYEINTPKRISAFLAQVGHESGSLRYVREIATGEAYDVGKLAVALGNTPEDDGDGEMYKGRGLIQITGLGNYKVLSRDFDVDFVSHPEKLEEPKYAALSAGWFWNGRKLNALADVNDFRTITKKINGGYNNYEDRLKHWATCRKALGLQPI